MKTLSLLLLLALSPAVSLHAHEGCTCDEQPATTGDAVKDATARHPLKGIVVDVLADQSALLVKHEEIPGVMKAMTMLLKVDAAASASVKKGDAVTGLLVRKPDGWWLEEVIAAK
jgi:Cu/Ag efflux protein CusF